MTIQCPAQAWRFRWDFEIWDQLIRCSAAPAVEDAWLVLVRRATPSTAQITGFDSLRWGDCQPAKAATDPFHNSCNRVARMRAFVTVG